MTVPAKTHKQDPLSIRLAESVVFLRGSIEPAHSRRRHAPPDAPPALLRGLLTVHLSKPTRISSIEIELQGKSAVQWAEGSAHRRLDSPEECTFLSSRTVFFDAKSSPSSNRSASVGPPSRGFGEDPFYDDSHQRARTPRSSFDNSLHPAVDGSPHGRRNSASEYRWQPDSVVQDLIPRTLTPTYPSTPPVSPPYTPIHAIAELPVVSRPQTPSDLRPENLYIRARSSRSEENPSQMLEEFRNALRMEMEGIIRSDSPRMSSSFVPPNPEPTTELSISNQVYLSGTTPRSESVPGSRSSSRDADHRHPRSLATSAHRSSLQHRRPASSSPSPSNPPAFLRPHHQVPTNVSSELDQDFFQSRSKRSSSRWSLANMSNVAKDLLRGSSKEPELRRGRAPQRRSIDEPHVDLVVTKDEGERKHREKERKTALGKLTAAVGLDEPPHVENWKEFRRGTYTYPVSFAIPPTTPPTIRCDFGTVTYRLKAVVHRPGALTSKLVATREVILVASPSEDDTEETHSIVVERQWDDQLRYLIALSGRSFVIGSQVPFSLTMFPMEKCKIYRLSVFLEEKTEYSLFQRQITREQPVKRFELLAIKHSERNPPPILPMSPESLSLLRPYLDTSTLSSTEDEALSSLMGPGPWVLTHELQLPEDCGKIQFTYKHKGSNISVSHVLKIVFRVERGDDKCVDPKTGKRRMFDIVVQTPVHILSCHCNPEWTSLPRYSLFESNTTDSPDSERRCACSGGIGPPLATVSQNQASSIETPTPSRPTTAERRSHGNAAAPAFGVLDSVSTATRALERHSDTLERHSDSHQFARLISGQESVSGDAPPEYQAMV